MHRMRRSTQFSAVVRSGSRARRGHLVVHQLSGEVLAGDPSGDGQPPAGPAVDGAPIVGLIVGKNVGGSVVRHQVSRRLRAQLSSRLGDLPARSATVVRALPTSATATSAELGADLDAALGRLAGVR
jgi:ribonuclease P protein component